MVNLFYSNKTLFIFKYIWGFYVVWENIGFFPKIQPEIDLFTTTGRLVRGK